MEKARITGKSWEIQRKKRDWGPHHRLQSTSSSFNLQHRVKDSSSSLLPFWYVDNSYNIFFAEYIWRCPRKTGPKKMRQCLGKTHQGEVQSSCLLSRHSPPLSLCTWSRQKPKADRSLAYLKNRSWAAWAVVNSHSGTLRKGRAKEWKRKLLMSMQSFQRVKSVSLLKELRVNRRSEWSPSSDQDQKWCELRKWVQSSRVSGMSTRAGSTESRWGEECSRLSTMRNRVSTVLELSNTVSMISFL